MLVVIKLKNASTILLSVFLILDFILILQFAIKIMTSVSIWTLNIIFWSSFW